MPTKVLILSTPDDVHAVSVARHLERMSVSVDYFRFEEFAESSKMALIIGGGSQPTICELARTGKTDLDFHSFSGIWHRRPGRLIVGGFPEPWIDRMVEQESRSALDAMFQSLPCVWVNHPRKDQQCMQKLWQLEIAQQVGLVVPPTLITNQPDLVREFIDQHDGKVIYKLISELSNFQIPVHESPRGISTLQVTDNDHSFLEQVRRSPHLFQKRIQKTFDLRVTIVGQQIFAIRIDSQSGRGALDWRHDYSVEMVPCDLPDAVADSCLGLMRRMGLNYGALDFCLTEEGTYVFLEINCAGQYKWIEKRTDLPISLELARLLAGKAAPLSHPIAL